MSLFHGAPFPRFYPHQFEAGMRGKVSVRMAESLPLPAGRQPPAATCGSKGWRIKYFGGKRTAIEGPFGEADQLVAGYTIIHAKSREEAMEWTRGFPNPAVDGKEAEIEVRRFFELEDFAPCEAIERFRKMGVAGKK